MLHQGFIGHIKSSQPILWGLLLQAANDGFIIIDEQQDAISATNRLLWTYPGLHLILTRIINSWVEKLAQEDFKLTHLQGLLQHGIN